MECHSARHINARPLPRWHKGAFALAFSLLAAMPGCDEKPPVIPQSPPKPATTQPMFPATRPTTRELVDGKRKQQPLGAVPLFIQVPVSWHLDSMLSGTELEGDTPHGEVRINIAMQGASLKPDSVAAMERRSIAQATSHPADLMAVPMRSIGGKAKMTEQREFLRHLPIQRDDGQIEYFDRVDWLVSVFIPSAKDYNVITLNFAGLSLEQYQLDHEFLEKILASMHYDSAAAGPE